MIRNTIKVFVEDCKGFINCLLSKLPHKHVLDSYNFRTLIRRINNHELGKDPVNRGEDKLSLTCADVDALAHDHANLIDLLRVKLVDGHNKEALDNCQTHSIVRDVKAVEEGGLSIIVVQALRDSHEQFVVQVFDSLSAEELHQFYDSNEKLDDDGVVQVRHRRQNVHVGVLLGGIILVAEHFITVDGGFLSIDLVILLGHRQEIRVPIKAQIRNQLPHAHSVVVEGLHETLAESDLIGFEDVQSKSAYSR